MHVVDADGDQRFRGRPVAPAEAVEGRRVGDDGVVVAERARREADVDSLREVESVAERERLLGYAVEVYCFGC